MLAERMNEIFQTLDQINYALLHHYEEVLEHKLTPKQSLIIEHVEQYGALTVNELAEKMNVTASAISQLLTKLEKEHYIERSINPNSRREIIVTLGMKGKELYELYAKADEQIVLTYYAKLDDEVINQLEQAVNKIYEVILEEQVKAKGE
ncbi:MULTISPECIES: MarR family winged helix-turn-helix transcriptional regulator [Sporosarcina]|uniref:DNA-binding transcriptional regulator, MarR family n=2 Tax=Sporosarcina TaxID=1569 RepID=A0A1T4YKL2_9BACL|nr:MarR family transcriptional regulator [Sporosarcina newyorkensis]SKB02240.1 DNA-binding transcriptional regulator, MarR family [Sporosarcina newyorkensis]